MSDPLILPPFYLNLIPDNGSEIADSEESFGNMEKRLKEEQNDHLMVNLAFALYEGKYVKQDLKRSYQLLDRAAKMGNILANFNQGVLQFKGEGVKKEDFNAANNWEVAAMKELPEAQLNYASMLISGFGVKMNLQRAKKFYNLAYDQGMPLAGYALGMVNYLGILCEKDFKKAAQYFKEAADNAEYSPAMYQYAMMCFNGEIKESNAEGLKYLKMAANLNDAQAMYEYAKRLESGMAGEKPDIECVMKNYRISAEKGHLPARRIYAKYLLEGKYIEPNDSLAFEYLLDCANNGDSEAMFIVSTMYKNGKGIDKNIRKSVEYCRKSSDSGFPFGQYKYSSLLRKGVPNVLLPDKEESLKLLIKSAENGCPEAQCYYATILKQGEEVRMNLEDSAHYFKLAADQGIKEAQYNYAVFLDKGVLATRDPHSAAKYFKLAADQGIKEAQLNYGLMLYTGDGIQKNIAESAEYFHKAAKQGIPKAMYMYGIILKDGCNGVVPNPKEAAKYLKIAAENDIDKAQYLYGMMCYKGEGIDVDLETASKYLKLAADKVYLDTKIPGYSKF